MFNTVRSSQRLAGEDLNSVNTDVWALTNLGGNCLIMVITTAVCILLLAVIEADIFQKCSNFSFFPLPNLHHTLDLD
jgi:hypothetical protein